MARMVFAGLSLLAALAVSFYAGALEVSNLRAGINDFARMMPEPSIQDLQERIARFKTETAYSIVVLTVSSLENESMENFGRKAFRSLPLEEPSLQRTVLLVVARKEQAVGLQIGSELRALFPPSRAQQKLQAQVEPYFNGMRPDLGIHAGVHYVFGVIRGEFRLDRATETEQLEEASKRGAGAGAIFAVCLAPFLAFFAGGLWGIYATHFGVQRESRLFVGAVLGGGTAKLVATLMAFFGSFGDSLWYFIMALSIPLGALGSWTEFWMGGNDWSGIPRVKDSVKRKPEDNMGI